MNALKKLLTYGEATDEKHKIGGIEIKKQSLILIACIYFLISALCLADDAGYVMENIVFKNVNIIPMNEEIVLKNYSVFVVEGKIEAIGRFEDLKITEATKIIDAENKYLLPGFSDMHIHINPDEYEDNRILYLANGVTLVRNMWGYLGLQNKIEETHKTQLLAPKSTQQGRLLTEEEPNGPAVIFLPLRNGLLHQ